MSQLLTKFQPKMTEIYQSIVIPKLDYDQVESSDNMNSEAPTEQESQNHLIIPSEQLLLSIVRMGSLTSIPKTLCVDHQDEDIFFPPTCTANLLKRCQTQLKNLPKPMDRHTMKRSCKSSRGSTRILQWNHLSQTLGTKNDNFVRCNPQALDWKYLSPDPFGNSPTRLFKGHSLICARFRLKRPS